MLKAFCLVIFFPGLVLSLEEIIVDEKDFVHVAAMTGNLETLKKIVEKEKEKNEIPISELLDDPDKNGTTPLQVAAMYNQVEIIRFLCQNSVNVSARWVNILTIVFDDGEEMSENIELTPLGIAMEAGSSEAFDVLLRECNVDLDVGDDEKGETPLHYAAREGLLQTVKYLLANRSVDVDLLDKSNRTALMIALKQGHLQVCEFLSHAGANINLKDKKNTTSLHFAASSGLLSNLTNLAKSIDVNVFDSDFSTPLHFCAKTGKLDACKVLLQNGADLNAKNKLNQTAKDVAKDYYFVNLYFYLKEFGSKNGTIFDENGDLQFISDSVTLSSSRIEAYVQFIREEPLHKTIAGKAYDDMIRLFQKGSAMEYTYKTLDDHLIKAKNNAGQWNVIFMKQQETFLSVKSFGSTFLTNLKDVDEKLPGVFSNLTESKIEDLLDKRREKLEEDGYPTRMISMNIRKYKKSLTGKPNSYDPYLDSIMELLSHVLIYADQCAKDSNETAVMLGTFSDNLNQDKNTFINDMSMLKKVRNETMKLLKEKMIKLSQFESKAEEYKTAINAAIEKVKEYQSQHVMNARINIGLQSAGFLISGTKGTFQGVSKVYSWLSKRAEQSKQKAFNQIWKNRAHQADIGMKPTKQMLHYEKLSGESYIKHAEKRAAKAAKWKGRAAKAMKGLRVLGVMAQFAGIGMSIYDLVTSHENHRKFLEEQKNVQNFTELLLETTIELTDLSLALRHVGMTTEQREESMKKVQKCIDKVSEAATEASFLSAKWTQVALHLGDMVKEAKIAKESKLKSVKESTFQYIKNHLIALRESWGQVSSNAFEIKKTLPTIESLRNQTNTTP